MANRPGAGRPGAGRPGAGRPGAGRPGSGGRPSAGDLGDFLGMDGPVRPATLPGLVPGSGQRPGIDRPDRPGNRPGIANRPGAELPLRPGNLPRPDLPGGLGNRPGFDRPGQGDRPINIGDINIGNNNLINNRPGWVNIDRDQINNIGNRWGNQINNLQNWGDRHPGRLGYWNGWADGVRHGWNHHYHDCFGPNWWAGHSHSWCGWHYGYAFNTRPWSYWWTYPTFAACSSWFNWQAPATVWSQPVYYDYGPGGNVVYQDNSVYIDGQQIATADAFAQSAAALATVSPPASEEEAAQAEWLSLGTFAISSSEKDVEPTRIIQLAVDKSGVVSGTLYNTQTDEAQTVQGQVDKQTQRVAMRIGNSEDVVLEAGLYNLTQDEAPVLVHFGTERVENWLFVRLEQPESDESASSSP